jgi:hypothetical protein
LKLSGLFNWFFSPLSEEFRYETGVCNPRRACELTDIFMVTPSALVRLGRDRVAPQLGGELLPETIREIGQ